MTGDQADLTARIKSVLPRWFGFEEGENPVLNALVQGAAQALAFIRSLIAFAALQTRIATATGGWLDLIAADYIDGGLTRFAGETDAQYSRRIRLEVLRDRNTRYAIDRAVFDLTGNHPTIYEGWRPATCGGLGSPSLSLGTTGRLGSSGAPAEVIVTTPAPRGYGIPGRPGWGNTVGGWGSVFSLASASDVIAPGPTPFDMIAALERVRTEGITLYVRFT